MVIVKSFKRLKEDGFQYETEIWYDFFCKEDSLKRRGKKMMPKVKQIVESPRLRGMFEKNNDLYVFFKNNDCSVGTYDDFRISSKEGESVLYTIVPSYPLNGNGEKSEVWGRENNFQAPLVKGTWWDIKSFFMQKGEYHTNIDYLIHVHKDGECKVAQYGQWDGSPLQAGIQVLNFLRDDFDLTAFKEQLSYVSFLSNRQIQEKWAEVGVCETGDISFKKSNLFKEKYPQLHRETGYEILNIIQSAKKDIGLQDFSLLKHGKTINCDWKYIIDLDDNSFSIYTQTDEVYPTKYYKVNSLSLNELPLTEEFVQYFI
ncbi:MAG: hypothetical protein ACOCQR_00875 [bacterium]